MESIINPLKKKLQSLHNNDIIEAARFLNVGTPIFPKPESPLSSWRIFDKFATY
jgi:hypothetical protein